MIIQNDRYKLELTFAGGEIQSFYDKELNIEYMYQGDSEFWGGKNPTLFPIIGNTFSKKYTVKGKEYSLKNHGLIRYATLVCVDQKENAFTLEMRSNEETLQLYPYAFTYHVTYTLIDNKVEIVYEITNDDEEIMPFTFGLHPGFRVPLVSGESFEDYTLSFEREENLKQLIFNDGEVRYIDKTMKDLKLNYKEMEERATLIYKDYSSSYVSLEGKKGRGVKVSIAGYPFLAIWTPGEGAPFLCIEPWYSHGDFEDNTCEFKDRIGMMSLETNKTFTTSYTIEVY